MVLTPAQFELISTRDDFKRLEAKVDRLADFVFGISKSVDSLVREMKSVKQELVANQVTRGRFDRRIGRTEKALKLKPMNA